MAVRSDGRTIGDHCRLYLARDPVHHGDLPRRPAGRPAELLESAAIDGAGFLQRQRYIVLPLLRNIILVAGLLQAVRFFQEMTLVFVLTQGGPVNATMVLSLYTYKTAFEDWDFGLASAIGTIWLALLLVFALLYVRVALRRGRWHEPAPLTLVRPARRAQRSLVSRRSAAHRHRAARPGAASLTVLLLPIAWMLSTSLKPLADVFRYPPRWIPQHSRSTNYAAQLDPAARHLLPQQRHRRHRIGVLATLAGALAAYGIARFRVRGRRRS